MNIFKSKPKLSPQPISPEDTRTLFCSKCGADMYYSTENSYHTMTGEPYISSWFNTCPNYNYFSRYDHDRFQWMLVGGWLPPNVW